MAMSRQQFRKQRRGGYLFDRWLWKDRVKTKLGNLVVELSTSNGDPAPPDDTMVTLAQELATFAKANDELLLDLIYGHYRYAEKEGWLEFWNVPAGLHRDKVLTQVESIELCVQRDCDDEIPCTAYVYVNPNWDPEHKLNLHFQKGKIVSVNDEPYVLKRGILYPKR